MGINGKGEESQRRESRERCEGGCDEEEEEKRRRERGDEADDWVHFRPTSKPENNKSLTLSPAVMSSPNYHGSLSLTPFQVTMTSAQLEQLKRDVESARLPPRTFENGSTDFGVSHAWMSSTLKYWREEFDW